jgi:maltooligosyltrehalose trehalohydrolase
MGEPLGALWLGDGRTQFVVWAPDARRIDVHFPGDDRHVALTKDNNGYFSGVAAQTNVGDTYYYSINGDRDRPDPASRWQPLGVHGPSAITSRAFNWTDAAFFPPTLRNSVFYELHVGTFTPAGTFHAMIEYLPYLRDLGITTLQMMPVAQAPGRCNWGYDGVQLYAPSSAYGQPDDLKALVNAAHGQGLAVFLDVVYNHLGPEGNYLWDYGPYFTNRYRVVWGDALNFDGRGSDEVRRFFIENALYWLDEFHIDGLRLDAIQALVDLSAVPFLEELALQVHAWADAHNRRVYLVGETDRSDRKTVLPREIGGTGLDGQWLDDFHHAVHAALSGETYGYYEDYADFSRLTKVLRTRFASTGGYSRVAGRRLGTDASDIPADRFVAFVQTHDQVGNRMLGDRLFARSGLDGAKLAAGFLLTSPYTPMLFMGEEYGEPAPFLFFTDFSDEALIEAVRQGRKADYAYFFAAQGEPPDPHDRETFLRSKLNLTLRHEGEHRLLYTYYQALLRLRRTTPALTNSDPAAASVWSQDRVICLERRDGASAIRILTNWALHHAQTFTMPPSDQSWQKILDSTAWAADSADPTPAPEFLPAGSPAVSLPPCAVVLYAT